MRVHVCDCVCERVSSFPALWTSTHWSFAGRKGYGGHLRIKRPLKDACAISLGQKKTQPHDAPLLMLSSIVWDRPAPPGTWVPLRTPFM